MVPSSDSIRKAGQIGDFLVQCVDECSNLWEDVDSVPPGPFSQPKNTISPPTELAP